MTNPTRPLYYFDDSQEDALVTTMRARNADEMRMEPLI